MGFENDGHMIVSLMMATATTATKSNGYSLCTLCVLCRFIAFDFTIQLLIRYQNFPQQIVFICTLYMLCEFVFVEIFNTVIVEIYWTLPKWIVFMLHTLIVLVLLTYLLMLCYVFAVMWTDFMWLLDYLPSADSSSHFNIAVGAGGMFDWQFSIATAAEPLSAQFISIANRDRVLQAKYYWKSPQ